MMAEAKEDQAAGATKTAESPDFSALLQKEFKPKSDRAREEVETAVRTLAAQVLADQDLIADDAVNSINAIVAEIDRKLAEQLNLIIHQPQFQQMESAWRGLHYLINNTETDEMLKIKVFNISKKELAKTLKRFKGTAWDQSPILQNRSTSRNMGSLAESPSGAWWEITTSTTRRRMSSCCRVWRRSPLPRTRHSSRRPHPRSCKWTRGVNSRIRAI